MTAELFVKLSAQLFAEQTDLDQYVDVVKVNSRETESFSSSSDDDDQEGSGGASLGTPSSNINLEIKPPTSVDANRPAYWHAMKLNNPGSNILQNRNPFSVLKVEYAGQPGARRLGTEESIKEEKKRKKVAFPDQVPKQWIPPTADSFWDPYRNKLRVNAVEGGVCDLDRGQGVRVRKQGKVKGDWV